MALSSLASEIRLAIAEQLITWAVCVAPKDSDESLPIFCAAHYVFSEAEKRELQ